MPPVLYALVASVNSVNVNINQSIKSNQIKSNQIKYLLLMTDKRNHSSWKKTQEKMVIHTIHNKKSQRQQKF